MSENKKKIKWKKWKKKAILAGIAVVVVLIAIFSIKTRLNNKKERLSTISKASLEKVIEISEISTLDYTYNAVATVYRNDGKKIKYYVAYNGIVTAGIDIAKLDVQVDEGAKKIVVNVPKAEVQSVNVDMGSLEFIFEKERFETESVSQEAYKASVSDLEARAKENQDLLELAKENALAAVKGLVKPWIEQIDEEYEVEFK